MRIKVLHSVLLLTTLFSCLATASNKKLLTVRVVAATSRVNERTSAYTTPGSASTNCVGTGTTVGITTTATANCQTTSTPAQTHQVTSITVDVRNTVEAEGLRYTIACRASWSGSNCAPLPEGDVFQAEIDDKTMWLLMRKGGNQGKEVRMKNSILDIRPAPTTPPEPRPVSSPGSTSSVSGLQGGDLAGTFGGTVRNVTVGVSAQFGVAIREEDGVVYGCIAIQPPLYGSGSLQGTVQGSKISFDSVGFASGAQFSIRFEGELHGGDLKGTYAVSSPAHQDGEFELTKRGAAAPSAGFNLKDCINSLSSF